MSQDADQLPSIAEKSYIAKAHKLMREFLASDYFIKVAQTFSTRIILILLSLATGVIIARTLGPEGRGVFAMALVLGTMGVQFTNFGLQASNTLYIARDPNLVRPLLGNSLVVSFGFGGGAAGLAWIWVNFCAEHL